MGQNGIDLRLPGHANGVTVFLAERSSLFHLALQAGVNKIKENTYGG